MGFENVRQLHGEVSEFLRYVDREVFDGLTQGSRVTIKAALWQSAEELERLKKALAAKAGEKGAVLNEDSYVISVYKEGLFWTRDVCLPELARLKTVRSVEIAYDPYSMAGDGKIIAENPPRALQDLYPVDAIIARRLSIPRSAVTFRADEDMTCTYTVTAYGRDRERIYSRSHSASYTSVPYLTEYPDAGACQIARSYVRSDVDGEGLKEFYFASDAQRVGDHLQNDLFPVIRRLLDGKSAVEEPLFRELRIDIEMGGVEEDGENALEMISAGETLEEGLRPLCAAYFQRYAQERSGSAKFLVTGGILCAVHYRDADPSVSVRLTFPSEIVRFTESGYGSGGSAAEPEGIPWNEDGLFGYEEYRRLMEALAGHPCFSVRKAGRSFEGRDIYSVEIVSGDGGSSFGKSDSRPCIFINGRHHANEVSASNGIAMLLRKFAEDELFREYAKKLRIIIVPMENVDSVAMHYELSKEHPSWQFHSCYENRLGTDLMQNYYRSEAPRLCPEAQVFTDILDGYRPVMIVDCHGVPHHEAGRQFDPVGRPHPLWLPRADMCCFYFHIDDERYKDNLRLTKEFQARLSACYRGDAAHEMRSREQDEIFMKYTPGADPLGGEAGDGLLHYYIPSPYRKDHPYPTVCRPDTVKLMLTAEAADETACGEDLRRAAELHLRNLICAIEFAASEWPCYQEVEQR